MKLGTEATLKYHQNIGQYVSRGVQTNITCQHMKPSCDDVVVL